ncbi:MAG: hypothetical protein HRU17_05470 [Polyangiaceae bacterium]|nr:hypothetical protein [Polyangiaceae bacterium]
MALKTFSLGFGSLALVALIISGCSDDTKPGGGTDAGTDSSATNDSAGGTDAVAAIVEPDPAPCGDLSCPAVDIGFGMPWLPGCCPENASASSCGVDTTSINSMMPLGAGCQPTEQPGIVEGSGCPDVILDPQTVPLPDMLGCCRPDNTCGAVLGTIDLGGTLSVTIGLGCIDKGPVTALGTPIESCVYVPPVVDSGAPETGSDSGAADTGASDSAPSDSAPSDSGGDSGDSGADAADAG